MYLSICAIIITYGLASTTSGQLYWYLDSITFNISVLIICSFFWFSLVQETDTAPHHHASRYTPVITTMMVFSTLALLYVFTSLGLYQTMLSQTFVDLSTSFYCLILAIWFIFFCQSEYETYSAPIMVPTETEACFDESPSLEQQEAPFTAPTGQFSDFCAQYELTDRETEILQLILAGKSNQEISDELFITVGTVKAHIHSIFGKLDVSRRSQLMTRFMDHGAAIK